MNQYHFTWNEPDVSDNNLFEVDVLLNSSFGFFEKLEILCVAECCGIDAFSFDAPDIITASKDVDKRKLIEDLEEAMVKLNHCSEKTLVSSRLNNLFDKSTFIHLLEHTITVLKAEVEDKSVLTSQVLF
jgi:hypothetical protein